MTKTYAQGDVLLIEIPTPDLTVEPPLLPRDPDGLQVLARGERSGHRHGFWETVAMFHDSSLGSDVVILNKPSMLVQDASDPSIPPDHGPVDLPPGAYEVRTQRKLDIVAPDDQRVARALD